MNHDYLIINVTTTKIENYDVFILGVFIKYHYIGIYNDVFLKGSFFIVVFLFHGTYLKYHCLISSLIIRITSYVMTLYRSVIVVIFHGVTLNNLYIYIYMF